MSRSPRLPPTPSVPPSARSVPAPGTSGLHAERLTVTRRHHTVLTDVTLTVTPGELLGLLGANGAGKSTLLAALAGELRPTAGHITLDGGPLAHLAPRDQARRRAVLPQSPSLAFALDVREVVAMGAYPFPELAAHDVDALVRTALAQAGALAFAHRPYLDLSGGEQQRVQFARVLAQCLAAPDGAPRYLLLDEPISSLDPKHQTELLSAARTLASERGIGVLVILHDVNQAARWCDRLALLADGGLLACGTPADVLTPAHLHHLYGVAADVMDHPTRAGERLVLFR